VNLKDDPHGYALKYASNELKADKEFFMAVVAINGRALKWASKELQADKEVVMAAHDDEHNFNGHDEYNPMNLKWA